MNALADALEAYAHAIAVGAPWRVQAERFVDLTAAHRDRMVELHAAEEAVARVWDRVLPAIEVDA